MKYTKDQEIALLQSQLIQCTRAMRIVAADIRMYEFNARKLDAHLADAMRDWSNQLEDVRSKRPSDALLTETLYAVKERK